MAFAKEFKDFIGKGNVIDLAVAVVIGAAFTKIVSALVEGLFMPIVGLLVPDGSWRELTVTALNIELGRIVSATVDFVVIGLVLFIVVKKLIGSKQKEAPKAPEAPKTKDCPECLESIPSKAKKCRACASPQAA